MKNIIDMLDLFYANKHLYDKIRQKEEADDESGVNNSNSMHDDNGVSRTQRK